MTLLLISAYCGGAILVVGAALPYLQQWNRNRRHSRPYIDRMLLEYCRPLLCDGERVLAGSKQQRIHWQHIKYFIFLIGIMFTWYNQKPNAESEAGLAASLVLLPLCFASLHRHATLHSIVVTTRAIYSCDFRSSDPNVVTTLLRHDSLPWLDGVASSILRVNGREEGAFGYCANRKVLFSAILDAIAALPPSPPPARPPS